MNKERPLSYVRLHQQVFIPGVGGFTDTLTPNATQSDKGLELYYQDNGVLMVATKSKVEAFIPLANVVNLVFAKV